MANCFFAPLLLGEYFRKVGSACLLQRLLNSITL